MISVLASGRGTPTPPALSQHDEESLNSPPLPRTSHADQIESAQGRSPLPEEHARCMLLECLETPEDLVKSELLECRSHVYSQLRRSLAHKCEL